MKHSIRLFFMMFFMVFSLSCTRTMKYDVQWHHPLYMANNDYWRQRIPVTITNSLNRDLMGDPVKLQIGKSSGQARIAGAQAQSIRVTTSDGGELTYRVVDKDGRMVERGPVPENGMMILPVECKADTSTTVFVYFDNPSAWAPGDYYKTHCEVLNESLELETMYGPLDWELSLPENAGKVEYAKGQAHTGERSIKIAVSATRQPNPFGATQKNLHLFSGEKYVVEGWVKGENIKGDARLTILFGNQDTEDFKLGKITASGGTGTFDWKKVILEFTVPEGVTGAHLQTLLEGTGTAWFDDLKITCTLVQGVTAEAMATEKLNLSEQGKMDEWIGNNPGWRSRTAVSTVNFGNEDISGELVCVDLEGVINRLHAEMTAKTVLRVTNSSTPVKYYRAGDYVLFKQDLKASSRQTNYIYFNSDENPGEEILRVDKIDDLGKNLIQNPQFENSLESWNLNIGPGKVEASQSAKLGTSSAGLVVPKGAPAGDVMIEQILPVKEDMTYFFSTWMKCTDMIQQPDFITTVRQRTLRAQFIAADGQPTGRLFRLAINPERHIDNEWTQLYMLMEAPMGSESVKVQLVNSAPGTVWFDDVIFTQVVTGATSPLAIERLGLRDMKELVVWQEDPIVKVFPDDLPRETQNGFSITVARNETEPLQFVMRSPTGYKNLQIKIDPPADANGNKLDRIETGIVGFVPINYPSSYYNDRVTPYWRQKIPTGRYGSDGWIGMWPDPILPFSEIDLKANTSQPVWIEFEVPGNAVPGDYSGRISLVNGGTTIKEIPYKVHVWNFELPDEPHMVAEYDARINNWDFIGYEKSETERMKEIWKMLADHRLCADAVTPAPVWTKEKESGNIVFDFTEYDKSASYYLDELNMQRVYTPWYFYLFGWANIPEEKFGEKPYPGEFPYPGVDRSKLRPEFKKAYQSAVKTYWNHMKEKGWADKVVFYASDEPFNDAETTAQMRALCNMIHEVDPRIPIYVSTWWYRPEYAGYVDVWGVSNHGGGWGRPVPVSDLESIKNKGGRLFFTTDGKMCTDTPYLGFERMLPYFCFKYGAEEYEFWGSNWYTFDPYQYGWHAFIRQSDRPGDLYWIRYPNGDANFIYPGKPIGVDGLVPTIRLKVAREGVEDHEYLYLLNKLITLSKKQGKDTGAAEKALKTATDLVTIPSSEGRYSTEYLPNPYVVMTARIEVGNAIETLLRK